ncbi:hypothetical protein OIU77_007388 [Salix suchowensis]|uniref:U6 snRNA phosphodiesterase 1 n=1 Tax=Salix suchowensis TaxID=1278906 RepID=A0ABQ9AH43_9ROSI|nr:hypothetical protein OIU77_007388 [Salix suchowensis]
MLRQKLQFQKGYWIDFNKWEVFVNDDKTRTFLSLEVLTGGLAEITKQIQLVNDVYKLHNLPEFYKDPRPHISLAWALGDVSDELKREVVNEMKRSGVGGSTSKRKKTYTKPKKIKHKKKKVKLAVLQFYKVDDSGKVQRLRKECPNAECGAGTFMANHFDRHYCGKCGLTYVYQKAGGD